MMRTLVYKSAPGFGVVELMVSIVIALISSLVIFETFAVSEGIKRTSTSGGDAQQNGTVSLYVMEREARMAGYGINNDALLGCTVRYYDKLGAAEATTLTLAPVVITPGANATDPDAITITFGDSDLFATPSRLISQMSAATDMYKVDNRYGYSPGDLVIAAEAGKDCTLAEVTEVPDDPNGPTDEIHHNVGNYVDANKNTANSRYNMAGGLGVAYSTQGTLYNFGKAPTRNRFRIANNQLISERPFNNPPASEVAAEQIVQFKAQYGKDDGVNNGTVTNAVYAADDGLVDSYSNTAPVTALDWKRVKSIRMAVVARSANAEKPSVSGGPCDTTTAAPTWAGGAINVSADAQWRCYRYRVFETVVPLRNLLWMQS